MGVFCGFGQEAEPDADELLKTARFVATLQHQDLTGHIRKEGIKFPVGLYLRGEDIQLSYTRPKSRKDVRFHMRLKEKHYDLFELEDGKTVRFPEAKLGQAIEGTDLSYEGRRLREQKGSQDVLCIAIRVLCTGGPMGWLFPIMDLRKVC